MCILGEFQLWKRYIFVSLKSSIVCVCVAALSLYHKIPHIMNDVYIFDISEKRIKRPTFSQNQQRDIKRERRSREGKLILAIYYSLSRSPFSLIKLLTSVRLFYEFKSIIGLEDKTPKANWLIIMKVLARVNLCKITNS